MKLTAWALSARKQHKAGLGRAVLARRPRPYLRAAAVAAIKGL